MNMSSNQKIKLRWYRYVSSFFAGIFLANSIPHYIQGVSGHSFPTPFGNPPGIGDSSATTNVLWGAFNLLVGYLLYKVSKTNNSQYLALVILYLGIIAQGILLSLAFSHKI